MTFSSFIATHRSASLHPRISPISWSACFVTFGLLATGVGASVATNFTLASLPNIVLLIVGVLVVDVALIRFAPRVRLVDSIQTALYGTLYLAVTVICAILAAYSLQRFAFPLQDTLFAHLDIAMGLDWPAYAHWVDRNALVQTVFRTAYDTIAIQTVLPVLVFAFAHRQDEARKYLLAYVVALTATIFISALLPAAGPVVFVDKSVFNILQFTGATPLDHLLRLREAGPLIQQEFPGGIATFPSFHATVAVLTPLSLRRHRPLFIGLLVVNTAMLGGTVTEGAHYFIDIIAGVGMAFFAYALAARILKAEDSLVNRRGNAGRGYAPADVPV